MAIDFMTRGGVFTPFLYDNSLTDESQTSSSSGHYSKVWNRVTISGHIIMTSLGSLTVTQGAIIGDLPFNGLTSSGGGHFVIGRAASLNITAGQVVSGSMTSTHGFSLYLWDVTSGTTTLLISELTATGQLYFSGNYVSTIL